MSAPRWLLVLLLFLASRGGAVAQSLHKEKQRHVTAGSVVRHQRCLALLGIFSTAKDAHLRQLHRRYLQAHAPHLAHFGSCGRDDAILVRFVLCAKVMSEELQCEQREFGDLIILQTDENMNTGKTLLYFAATARMSFNSEFILKADIDAFIHTSNLVATLQVLQSTAAVYKYYGRVIGGFPVPDKGWIMGCLYGMSFNLVQQYALLAESWTESLRGGEDKISTKIAARFLASSTNASCDWRSDDRIHDHPDCGCGPNSVAFTSQTVAVHQLKALSLWNSTLSYFLGNASAQLVLRDFSSSDFPGLRYRTCKLIVD